jgi:hypothetical protein
LPTWLNGKGGQPEVSRSTSDGLGHVSVERVEQEVPSGAAVTPPAGPERPVLGQQVHGGDDDWGVTRASVGGVRRSWPFF